MIWHTESHSAIAIHLKTDLQLGLSSLEASARLQAGGVNELTQEKHIGPLKIFIRQFNSVVIWVLLSATLVSSLLREYINAIAILAIVILNAIIGFMLEYRADRAITALKGMTTPQAKVIRDDHRQLIPASQIVPGDILCLESGDVVAADARLFKIASLKINEASLTGESLPVEKNIALCLKETPLADQLNMVFMGTAVVNGTGHAMVVATGMQTEMGHIATMLQKASSDETPLQKRLNQVAYRLLWACFAIILLIFGLGLWQSLPFFSLFTSAVGLAVAAIPEGLPAVVTVALAMGVQRMARRSVLVRHMSAVETLGCLQVICTDKTGTLTIGEMTARKLIAGGIIHTILGEGYDIAGNYLHDSREINANQNAVLQQVLRAAVACNEAELDEAHSSIFGDPTEIALLVAAAKAGIWKKEIEQEMPRVAELPFDSERKRMSVIRRKEDAYKLFIKGAPEAVLKRCSKILLPEGIEQISKASHIQIQQSCEWMAADGLRILAIAERLLPEGIDYSQVDDSIEVNLTLLGIVGMQDPPHPEAKRAVQQCKTAGIKAVMITGDHPATAQAIAQELGIFSPGDKIVTGSEIEKMTSKDLANIVNDITVYARVSPEHKIKIVEAWKQRETIVAMTGDGVNDAPALKAAAVGIAMGKTATDVTKEAADIIVTDNNFMSIVAGVEEGRTIYNNISKTLSYLLAGNAGELIVMFIAILVGWPLPLLVIQLLWINLITDGLPAIALATDASEPDILKRAPRPTKKPFMDKAFFQRVIFIGCLTSLVTLGTFAYYYLGYHDLTQARDSAFSVLVTAELLRAFGARSHEKTIWQVNIFSNLRLFFIVSVSFFLQVSIHHVSILQKVFGIKPVSLLECISWVVLGMIPLAIMELHKGIRNRRT
ncbi:MAG: cation-translocating P-type ATPase [Gammaproteobacteria bacterium]|nr:cation-translocating P-type ATPase [Gammaproteobacteria bacterium]